MEYNILKHSKTLELDAVLQMLAAQTATEDAHANSLNIVPDTDIKSVKRNLGQTEAAYLLISKYSSPSLTVQLTFYRYLPEHNSVQRLLPANC